jgi:hypothetical protein
VTWIEIEPGVWLRDKQIDPDVARDLMAQRLESHGYVSRQTPPSLLARLWRAVGLS